MTRKYTSSEKREIAQEVIEGRIETILADIIAGHECQYCNHLSYRPEDNRFDVPSRGKGDRTTYGEPDIIPVCELKEIDIDVEQTLFCKDKEE